MKPARRAYSPADLEAVNVNLVGGDPYGGSCGRDQFFLWRPFKGTVNHRTPVPGLYHIGASIHPGPGPRGRFRVLARKIASVKGSMTLAGPLRRDLVAIFREVGPTWQPAVNQTAILLGE